MRLKEIIQKYDAFIFDFDGVIVDSLAIKAEAFTVLFQDLGAEVMKKVKEHHLSHGGVSRYEKFKYYYREFRGKEITSQESAAMDKQYSELVVRRVIEANTIAGVMDFLDLIKAEKKFCSVISATPQQEIRHIVKERKMTDFFNEVLGSPASKKDNLRLIIKDNGLLPKKTIYFGDAQSDHEAAQFCGIDFVGIIAAPNSELNKISGIKSIRNFIVG
jgi:beta-phosphoglucomutase-like phosphatase (HAD superfamily)